MKRKNLLLIIAMVLVIALNAGPALAKTLIKTQSIYPTRMPIGGEIIPIFANWVKELSDGDLTFKIYEPGKLVSTGGILDSVSKGRIQAAYSSAGFWAGKLPAAPFFASVPFGPEAPEFLAWMIKGNGLKLYQEMYDRAGYNVKVLPIALAPPESAGWFRKEIKSVEDLKGLKMRIYGLGGSVMEKLGVAVVALPPGEIFPALEKGAIDAAEFSIPIIDYSFGFHRIAKYNYFPGWHQPSMITELLINKDVWEKKLTPSQRKMIEVCSLASLTWTLGNGEATQGKILKESAQKNGVKNMYWSDDFLKAYKQAWQEVVEEECAKDDFFKKVWNDLTAFRDEYALWGRLGYLPRETGVEK